MARSGPCSNMRTASSFTLRHLQQTSQYQAAPERVRTVPPSVSTHDPDIFSTELLSTNGTISGPVLNATLSSEIFTQTTYKGVDADYIVFDNRYVWYTDDGIPFSGPEIGLINSKGTITKPVSSSSLIRERTG